MHMDRETRRIAKHTFKSSVVLAAKSSLHSSCMRRLSPQESYFRHLMILKIYLERYRAKNMVFPVEMCSIISFMLQVDKGSTGSVPDSFDPYFVSIQDLSTEDASTVPNASDSFSLERLGKKIKMTSITATAGVHVTVSGIMVQ
jgi:hypothetical protein